MKFIVVGRDDTTPDGHKGAFVLATRTVFKDARAAELYASTITASREPAVVAGKFAELRFDEARGTARHWINLGMKLPKQIVGVPRLVWTDGADRRSGHFVEFSGGSATIRWNSGEYEAHVCINGEWLYEGRPVGRDVNVAKYATEELLRRPMQELAQGVNSLLKTLG